MTDSTTKEERMELEVLIDEADRYVNRFNLLMSKLQSIPVPRNDRISFLLQVEEKDRLYCCDTDSYRGLDFDNEIFYSDSMRFDRFRMIVSYRGKMHYHPFAGGYDNRDMFNYEGDFKMELDEHKVSIKINGRSIESYLFLYAVGSAMGYQISTFLPSANPFSHAEIHTTTYGYKLNFNRSKKALDRAIASREGCSKEREEPRIYKPL